MQAAADTGYMPSPLAIDDVCPKLVRSSRAGAPSAIDCRPRGWSWEWPLQMAAQTPSGKLENIRDRGVLVIHTMRSDRGVGTRYWR